MSTQLKLHAAALALSMSFLAAPAFAAGGESSGDPAQCKQGEVYDKEQKKCVQKNSAVDDDSLFETGRAYAYAGRYGEAIEVLGLVSNKNDPRVLNMLGFSHRKSGRVDVGLGYYEEALALNPDFVLAREYMGEAFITLGQIDKAREQLSEIEKRCGKGCAEYAALERQIDQVN